MNIFKKISDFYDKILIKLAFRDKTDRFKKTIIIMMIIKKIVSFNRIRRLSGIKRYSYSDENINYESGDENENFSVYLNSCFNLFEYLYPSKDCKVLHYGCGKGYFLKRLYDSGYKNIFGIENSDYYIKNKVFDNIKKTSFESIEKESYDTVCVFNFLEHIPYERIDYYVKNLCRISSRWIVASIQTYPSYLAEFYDHKNNIIFERRKWWDDIFVKYGFYPAYLPSSKLNLVEPFIYFKKTDRFNEIWDGNKNNLIRIKMGLGDSLCVLPSLYYIKSKFPEITISLDKDSSFYELIGSDRVFDNFPVQDKDINIVEFHVPDKEWVGKHLISNFAWQAGLSEAIGDVLKISPGVFIDEKDVFDFKFEKGVKYIAVDTRAGWVSRKWPHDRFEYVCKFLREKYGIKIIEVGKNNWHSSVKGKERLKNSDFSFVDKLNLRQTAWLISKCGFFFGNDSGLAHVALSVGAVSFIIYGPAEAELRKYNNAVAINDYECYGCYTKGLFEEKDLKYGCPLNHHKCMNNLKPDYVIKQITEIINYER